MIPDRIHYADDIYRCADTDASLRIRQRDILDQTTRAIPFDSPASPPPKVNHGRWLVDCACGSCAGISRAGIAYCCNCGAIMRVTLPPITKREAAESILLQRRLTARNWHPDREPVEVLLETVTP